jgi:hypothetical protein
MSFSFIGGGNKIIMPVCFEGSKKTGVEVERISFLKILSSMT